MNNTDYKAALDVRFDSDAGDGLTVRGVLRTLLTNLWSEQECFSAKRPFGDFGWDYDWERDVIGALAYGGFVDLGPQGPLTPEDTADGVTYTWRWNPTQEQMQMAHAYVADLIAFALQDTEESK
jgi:hypothetical protein